MLQGLPPEIVHSIFQNLWDLDGVLAARLTYSLFAYVGAEYLLEEVAIVYHRDRFNALCEIANHRVIVKCGLNSCSLDPS